MNIYDKAWAILQKFVPDIEPQDFKKLTFDPTKSKAENKEIMIKEIAEGRLGPLLSIAAQWFQKHKPSKEESETFVESKDLQTVDEELNKNREEAETTKNSLEQDILKSKKSLETFSEETASQADQKNLETENS